MATDLRNPAKVPERRWWSELAGPDGWFFVSKNLYRRTRAIPLHDHDFAEILWLTEGRVVHSVNGSAKTMQAGDLVMILPEDCHQIASAKGEPYSIINIGIPAKMVPALKRRYRAAASEWFARETTRLPKHYELDQEQMLLIEREFKWLSLVSRSRLTLETFCLNLLRLLGAPTTAEKLPGWLDAAMRRFSHIHAEAEKLNLNHFIRLCARSPEHVSRRMREHLDTTPSEWVNQHRLMVAARLLESTSKPVSEVAAASGFQTTVYFHRLFRSVFQATPLQYRKRNRVVF